MTDLITISDSDLVSLYSGDNLDKLLAAIEVAALAAEPDLKTVASRAAIAKRARAVAKSKGVIDDAGKNLVADWKKQAKAVDEVRARARTTLDALRDKVRKPLTDWEAEQAKIKQAKIDAILAEQEAEEKRLAEEAEAARAKAEAEAQAQREEMQRREADMKAREEAVKERERAAAHERELIAAANRERAAAEERQKIAVSEAKKTAKLAAQRAAEKADRDRKEAVRAAEEKIRREAAEVESKRLRAEEEARAAAQDEEHKDKVHGEIITHFARNGFDQQFAKSIAQMIAKGQVPYVTIDY